MSKKGRPYTLDLPRGWEDQTVFTFSGPEVDDRTHLVMMTLDRHPRTEVLEEFVRDRTVPIVGAMDAIDVLKHAEITVENGNPAWEFVYKWVPGEGVALLHMYVFVLSGGVGFMFSVQFTKRSYQILGDHVRDLIEELLPGTYESPEED